MNGPSKLFVRTGRQSVCSSRRAEIRPDARSDGRWQRSECAQEESAVPSGLGVGGGRGEGVKNLEESGCSAACHATRLEGP